MSLDFLTPAAAGALARSSMEPLARAAGARFEIRGGWNVAVAFGGGGEGERGQGGRGQGGRGQGETAAWADVSHLTKLELQGASDAIDAVAGTPLPLRTAVRRAGAWWCRLTPARALIVGQSSAARERMSAAGARDTTLVDVTTNYAALTLVGPLAAEVLARLCALDLRPAVTPVGALRPGSIGRQPGILIREAEHRFLVLFGWATGEYMWSLLADAAEHLGGRPIGADALEALAGAEPVGEPVGA